MSVWCTTCPVCLRPAGRVRHCPYCDEPLPTTAAYRRIGSLAAAFAVLGGTLVVLAPAGGEVVLASWPSSASGLALAFLLGVLGGSVPGVFLPVLLLAVGMPSLPLAVALGACAPTAAFPADIGEVATGENAVGEAVVPGVPSGRRAGLASVVVAWGWLILSAYRPAVLATLRTLATEHAYWIVGAVALTGALLAQPVQAIPPLGRCERLLAELRAPLLGVLVWGCALIAGRVARERAASAVAASMGLLALAPFLWERVGHEAPEGAQTPRDGARRQVAWTSLLAVVVLATTATSRTAVPALLGFAVALTVAQGAHAVVPLLKGGVHSRSWSWLPAAAVGLWLIVAAGSGSCGVILLVASLGLLRRLCSLPAAVELALWVPWLL